MTVMVNGDPVEVAQGATVDDLLVQLNLGGKWVIVERNGEPVERRAYASTTLQDGDRLELVRAVAGADLLLRDRRLYLCTPDRPDLDRFLDKCIRGGVDVVQLRDKRPEATARQILERARIAQHVCGEHGVPFILNDRPDLAVEIDADGVHVGQDDAPASLARRLLGPDKIVGLSTHATHELDASEQEPVDYISAGPVNPTPTKPGRPGTGLDYLGYAAANSNRPFFVTGGATPETIPEMKRAGATRFVVVRYLTESPDPETAARRLTEAIYAD